jgi:GNAT superfamily N-acetyltransferase
MSREGLALVQEGWVELPPGYGYADQDGITVPELNDLNVAVEGPPATPLHKPDWTEKSWERCFNVGVRTADDQLVGYGRLAISIGTSGELSHLMVHPEHQRRGLGTAILAERMRIGEALGVKSFHTRLAQANAISNKYYELGFQDRGNKSMTRPYVPSLSV